MNRRSRDIEPLEPRQLMAYVLGDPVRVDTDDATIPSDASIAMAADGSFVVAWDTNDVNTDNLSNVYARRFAPDGSALGDPFVVAASNEKQMAPDVAMNASGDFVITWERGELDEADIYARCFDETGAATTAAIHVNTRTEGSQFWSTVGISAAGNFTVAWTTEIRSEFGSQLSQPIAMRRFAADGTPVSDETVLHEPAEGESWNFELAASPDLAMAPDGRSVLAWAFGSAHAQIFDPNGAPVGNEINVSNYGPGALVLVPRSGSISVAIQPDGDFGIAWREGQSLAYFQQFDSVGIPLHPMQLLPSVSDNSSYVDSVAVTYNAAGNAWVVADADWYHAQQYDATGQPIGDPIVSGVHHWKTLKAIANLSGGLNLAFHDWNEHPGIYHQIHTIDNARPTVSAATFEFETARRVHLGFSELVTLSGNAALTDRGSGAVYSIDMPTSPSLTTTANLAIPSSLGDGNYRLTVPASAVVDRAGNLMVASYTFDFFILAGDANHDRNVDIVDLKALTSNWMQTNRTFSQGDFNYDGTVDQSDLAILATKWNTTLQPYVEPVPTTAPAPTPNATKKTRTITSLVLT